jgi:hypothetical protein
VLAGACVVYLVSVCELVTHEDPAPAPVTAHAIHVRDASGEQAGESARERCSAREIRDARGDIGGHVPRRGEVDGAGEEARSVFFLRISSTYTAAKAPLLPLWC